MDIMNNPIFGYKVASRADNDAFNGLKEAVKWATNSEQAAKELEPFEEAYMSEFHDALRDYAMKKDGTWKYRAYKVPVSFKEELDHRGLDYKNAEDYLQVFGLPNAYMSAKSVVLRAIDAGLDLTLGKSALDALLKGNGEASDKSEDEKVMGHWNSIKSKIRQGVVSSNVINIIREEMGDLV